MAGAAPAGGGPVSTPPVPAPVWAQRLFAAAKADQVWIGQVAAAAKAVTDARRVSGEARAAEQAATQRRIDAEAAVDQHAAVLRDLLATAGEEEGVGG